MSSTALFPIEGNGRKIFNYYCCKFSRLHLEKTHRQIIADELPINLDVRLEYAISTPPILAIDSSVPSFVYCDDFSYSSCPVLLLGLYSGKLVLRLAIARPRLPALSTIDVVVRINVS